MVTEPVIMRKILQLIVIIALSCAFLTTNAAAQLTDQANDYANVSGYEPTGDEAPGFIGALSSYYCATAANMARFGAVSGLKLTYTPKDYRTLGQLFILQINETNPFQAGEIEQMPGIFRDTAAAQMGVDLRAAESEASHLVHTIAKCERLYRAALPDRPVEDAEATSSP